MGAIIALITNKMIMSIKIIEVRVVMFHDPDGPLVEILGE